MNFTLVVGSHQRMKMGSICAFDDFSMAQMMSPFTISVTRYGPTLRTHRGAKIYLSVVGSWTLVAREDLEDQR
jgi:hypothetical protein